MAVTKAPITLERLSLKIEWFKCTLFGEASVANIAFQKNVIVRYSLDQWDTWVDVPASYRRPYTPSAEEDPNTSRDVFSFEAVIPHSDLPQGEHECYVEFCLVYETAGQTFTDNNGSKNYCYKLAMLKGTPWAPAQVSMLTMTPSTREVYGTIRVHKKMAFNEKVVVRFTRNNWMNYVDIPADLFFNGFDRAYYSFKFNSSTDAAADVPIADNFEEFRYQRRRSTSYRQFPADFYDDLTAAADSIDDPEKVKEKDTTDYHDFAFKYADLDEELELALANDTLREELRKGFKHESAAAAAAAQQKAEKFAQEAADESARVNMIGFALCYYADDREHWDNNDGKNYGYTEEPEKPAKKVRPAVEKEEEKEKVGEEGVVANAVAA